jgi:hypothetical protein
VLEQIEKERKKERKRERDRERGDKGMRDRQIK